jgi:hypothetical protein
VARLVVCIAAISSLAFDTTRHEIPLDQILSGGPPKDGIPALLTPKFVSAAQATHVGPTDPVVGLVREGVAKAYPIAILNWHEVVNDKLGDSSVAVTYCPLTGSAVVYDRSVGGKTLSFGVSGRLYQSNVLLYDHQTESLWSQLKERAVTGEQAGTSLKPLPSVATTWQQWRARYPNTLVLSADTGVRRDYERDPYARYRTSPEIMFPVSHEDTRLPAKATVFGVRHGGESRAYPLIDLAQVKQLEDRLGGQRIRIDVERVGGPTAVVLESNETIPGVVAYWFAWAAFHPDTAIWMAAAGSNSKSP